MCNIHFILSIYTFRLHIFLQSLITNNPIEIGCLLLKATTKKPNSFSFYIANCSSRVRVHITLHLPVKDS